MPEWVKECLTKHWRLSWASKSRLGTDPRLGRLAVTAADGGRRPQEKDKLSDKPTVRCKASAGRPTPESKRASACVRVCVLEDGNESRGDTGNRWISICVRRRVGTSAGTRGKQPLRCSGLVGLPLHIPLPPPPTHTHQRERFRAFRDFLLMCEKTQSTLMQSLVASVKVKRPVWPLM